MSNECDSHVFYYDHCISAWSVYPSLSRVNVGRMYFCKWKGVGAW